MLGVVAVIVNTLNGLDRVPRVLLKTARIHAHVAGRHRAAHDAAVRGPYLLTGAKLAVAYAFIGVIGSEFIMSRGGIGYEISFAYTNFDNATMYPLIVLILLASIAINTALLALGAAPARAAGHAMSERTRDGARNALIADRGAARAVAGAVPVGGRRRARRRRCTTFRYTAQAGRPRGRSTRICSTRMRAFADRVRAVGGDRARWSASGSASTGCPATRSSR